MRTFQLIAMFSGALATILLSLAATVFRKSVRKRFPVLLRLDGHQLLIYLTFLLSTIICIVAYVLDAASQSKLLAHIMILPDHISIANHGDVHKDAMVTLYNQNDQPVFALGVMLTVNDGHMSSKDVSIDRASLTNTAPTVTLEGGRLAGRDQPLPISTDLIGFDCLDARRRSGLLVVLYTLEAHNSRTLRVISTGGSSNSIRIEAFMASRHPIETLALGPAGLQSFQLGLPFDEAKGPLTLTGIRFTVDADALGSVPQIPPSNAEQTLRELQADMARDPSRLDIVERAGDLASVLGKFDLAEQCYERAKKRPGLGGIERGALYFHLGTAQMQDGNLKGAVENLKIAAGLVGRIPQVQVTLAMALDQSGARQEAAQSYREVLKWDAINSIALNNLAYLLADAGGDLDEALKHARTANELFPGWATFLDTLGWVYYKRGETDAAVGQLCKAVRKNPRNVAYRQHLLRALEQKDEHSAMVEELKAALRNGGAGQTILALLDQMGK